MLIMNMTNVNPVRREKMRVQRIRRGLRYHVDNGVVCPDCEGKSFHFAEYMGHGTEDEWRFDYAQCDDCGAIFKVFS